MRSLPSASLRYARTASFGSCFAIPGRHGPTSARVRRTGSVLTANLYAGLMALLSGRAVTNHPLGYSKAIPCRSKRPTPFRALDAEAPRPASRTTAPKVRLIAKRIYRNVRGSRPGGSLQSASRAVPTSPRRAPTPRLFRGAPRTLLARFLPVARTGGSPLRDAWLSRGRPAYRRRYRQT